MREPLSGDRVGEFWDRTIAESSGQARAVDLTPVTMPLHGVRAFDVRFSGFGGERIAAWLLLPDGDGPFPTVVEYIGHGGGRGYPHEHLLWPAAGYAHFVMDVRGQGSEWRIGVTPDAGTFGPGSGAFFTRGIEHQDSYFYRRLYTDGVLAVDAASSLDAVDSDRIAITGASQGGGVTVAVAALRSDLRAAMPDVPAFASWRAAIDLVEVGPYLEIAGYLAVHRDRVDATFDVLRYFDTAVLAQAAIAPALFSLGGRDDLVPASTIRDIVAAYAGPVELADYAYNGHEGGGALHALRKIEWLGQILGGADGRSDGPAELSR